MAVLWGKTYSRTEILRRVGDIRQIAQVEPFSLRMAWSAACGRSGCAMRQDWNCAW